MKMMKTDMEFVTFDAQDVITTSGPTPTPTGIHFKVTDSLFDLKEGPLDYWGNEWYTSDGDLVFGIYGPGTSTLDEGTYYTISEGASYTYTKINEDGYGGGLWINSGFTVGNNGAEEKTSLSSILAWLGENVQ